MSIQVGSRVRVRYKKYDPASGLTGTVDEIDESWTPYHVKFDAPRNEVESAWFMNGELVEVKEQAEMSTTEQDSKVYWIAEYERIGCINLSEQEKSLYSASEWQAMVENLIEVQIEQIEE